MFSVLSYTFCLGLCEKCLEIARAAAKQQEQRSEPEVEEFAVKRRRHKSAAVKGSASDQSIGLKQQSRDDLAIERFVRLKILKYHCLIESGHL